MAVILCYGDSNTHGTPPMKTETSSDRFGVSDRWPGVMAQELVPGHAVIEEGLPGRTVCHDDPVKGPGWNGMGMLPAVLATHTPVDLLIVMLGTNDFQHRFAMTGHEVAIALMRLAEQVAQSGQVKQQLFIVPTPVREEGLFAEVFTGVDARQATLKNHMLRLLPPFGVTVLDAARHAVVDVMDGVHLDMESHHRLGRAVAVTVREMVAKQTGQGA